jgi:hypothetical protein
MSASARPRGLFVATIAARADEVLADLRRKGLEVRLERATPGDPAGRHWHLAYPGRPGTLELTSRDGKLWVKVHPRRDGGWATGLASELAANDLADGKAAQKSATRMRRRR